MSAPEIVGNCLLALDHVTFFNSGPTCRILGFCNKELLLEQYAILYIIRIASYFKARYKLQSWPHLALISLRIQSFWPLN